MPTESIFHKLVKHEPSYTQLLCNVLRRDEKFRNDFFGMEGIDLTASVKPEHIHVEKHLGEHGRADIWIRSTDLLMIVEVKTSLLRGLEESQLLVDDGKRKNYLDRLKQEADGVHEVRIVYLAPRKWLHWDDTATSIREFNNRTDCDVRAGLISWESVTSILPGPDKMAPTISVAEDFQMLLSERFGPVNFDKEEVQIMFNRQFPMELFLKLVTFLDEVRSNLAPEPKFEKMTKDEFGFHLKGGTCWLYVGYWLDFWEGEAIRHPLCFGVDTPTPGVREAFTKSLLEVCNQAPTLHGNWIMGWVPDHDLLRADAVGHVSGNLQRIFDSISQAAS